MMTRTIQALLALVLLGRSVTPFTSSPAATIASRRGGLPSKTKSQRENHQQHRMLPTDVTSFWTAVEVFDGSSIVDPVVVSNVFWTSLQAKLFSFVIGQFLAAAVFSILLSFFASQFTKVADFMSEKIFSGAQQQESPKGIKIPKKLRDDDTTTTNNNSKRSSATIQPDYGKLLICLAIDIIGTSSELVPFVGEVSDIVWAPIGAAILRSLFNGSNILFVLEFTEEILPFTDILPLATLCWVIETFFRDSDLAKVLQLGSSTVVNQSNDRPSAIDVEVESRRTRKQVGDVKLDRKN